MVKKISQNEFNEVTASEVAVIDFSATWCGPVSYTHLDVYKRQVVHVRYGKGITYAALLCNVYGGLLDPVFVWGGGTPSAGSSNAVL